MIVSGVALPAGDVHPGDAQSGAGKAAVCQACHGANGNSASPQFPSLAGIGADYIAEQLQSFKDGKRNNPIMMPLRHPWLPRIWRTSARISTRS